MSANKDEIMKKVAAARSAYNKRRQPSDAASEKQQPRASTPVASQSRASNPNASPPNASPPIASPPRKKL